jgi:carboxyl-terminal processing protease
VVVAPLEDSPAEREGLQPGDIVLAVDGVSVEGSTLHEQVNRVRGPAGTEVTLTISRDKQTFDVTIERAEIQIREVATRMLDERIGYIKLNGFSTAASEQFRSGLQELLDAGAQQIVLDLRGNPGGYIETAVSIASQFINDGVIFTQESAGDEVETWNAESGGLVTDPSIEVAVLTNGGTASASEIVAAALKEHDRATVIGERTFGKNTVQVWGELENGAGVRITISRWFTPDHGSVAPDGIEPDIAVRVPEDSPPDADPVLDRAVAHLESRPVGYVSRRTIPAAAPEEPPSSAAPASYDPRGLTQAAA